MSFKRIFFLAILAPALLGLVGVALSVYYFEAYGWVLFLVLPVMVAFGSAVALHRCYAASLSLCIGIALLSLLLLLVFLLCFAMEGVVCLLMAVPLVLPLAIIGSLLGHVFGRQLAIKTGRWIPLLSAGLFPALMAFEAARPFPPTVHQVTTRVEIQAPITEVWEQVIAFDRITTAPEGIFRMGIAYPIEAKIEGTGIGAIRHCIFSTGPFVEPITRWDPPHALEFDVTVNPIPLKEWSPWPNVHAPHLHDTFKSERGQFHLVEREGRTILEGTTWYRQTILPDWYWHRISDYLIHQIHLRVLNHIKARVENPRA